MDEIKVPPLQRRLSLSLSLLTSHKVQMSQSESLCKSATEQKPLLGKHWLWAPATAAGEGVDVCR